MLRERARAHANKVAFVFRIATSPPLRPPARPRVIKVARFLARDRQVLLLRYVCACFMACELHFRSFGAEGSDVRSARDVK